MKEKKTRSMNPISFEEFLPAYQKAIQDNLTRKQLADLLNIEHKDLRYIETHLTFLKNYCKKNGLTFQPLAKDMNYEHLRAEAKKKNELIEKLGIFSSKKK